MKLRERVEKMSQSQGPSVVGILEKISFSVRARTGQILRGKKAQISFFFRFRMDWPSVLQTVD